MQAREHSPLVTHPGLLPHRVAPLWTRGLPGPSSASPFRAPPTSTGERGDGPCRRGHPSAPPGSNTSRSPCSAPPRSLCRTGDGLGTPVPGEASGACRAPCRRSPARSARALRPGVRRTRRAAARPGPRIDRRPSRTGSAAPSTGSRRPRSARSRRSSLVPQQRVQVLLAQRLGQLIGRGRRPRLRAELRDRFVALHVTEAQQLGPGPLARAELLQPQLASIVDTDQQPRGLVAQRSSASNTWRRPADIRCTSSATSPNSTTGIFPIRRTSRPRDR